MRIGIVIGRIGGIDGVALETEKWITVLQRMGHEVVVLSGALEGEVAAVELLPELAFDHYLTQAAQAIAFFGWGDSVDERTLLRQLDKESDHLARGILAWLERQRIDCVLVENASALPFHLTMGMALKRVYEQTRLPVVSHEHDFAWERGDRYRTPFEGIAEIVADCFAVALPNVRHAVINRAARDSLRERSGIDNAVVVPNVMDFDQPFAEKDAYNADLRAELGMAADDLLLVQITRIVRRKGIETAIELVERLADPRVKLVVTGDHTDDPKGDYFRELCQQVEQLGLDGQVLFAGDRFDNQRKRAADGHKIYALADGYAQAAACTYFSTYEGFGNAFVEAVVARRPIFVNNYRPVYWPDIGSLGFRTVMIEDSLLSSEAIEQVRAVLCDAALAEQMSEHNYALGREHFSYQALERIISPLFSA